MPRARDPRLLPNEPDPEANIVVRSRGREYVKAPWWLRSMADAEGYVMLKRYRMACQRGRPLRGDEEVWERDGKLVIRRKKRRRAP